MGATDPDVEHLLADLLAGTPGVREALLVVLRAARTRGDAVAAARAATLLLLHTLAGYTDFRALAEAMAAFDPEPADPADRRRADAVRLNLPSLDHALSHADPALVPVRARLVATLRDAAAIAPDERLLLAKQVVDHDGMRNDLDAGRHLLAAAQEVLPSASPRWQAHWWALAGEWHSALGQEALARAAQEQLQALSERHDLSEARLVAAMEALRTALRSDDRASAARASRSIDRLRSSVAPALLPRALRLQTALLLRRGEYQAALDQVALTLALAHDHEAPERELAGYLENRAYALAGLGRHDEAIALLEGLRSTQLSGQGDMLEAVIAMQRAFAALEREADPRPAVLAAVERAAACGLQGFLRPFPEASARVAAIGLEAGCQVEMLQHMVRVRRLPPPPQAGERWPWALQLRLLGGFELRRDGVPLSTVGGKAQKKPQQLLVLLAVHPAGLDAETLIDELWPSLEADAPRASLEMAVSRLRKWLDLPEAVRVADGRLSLHPQLAWTDVGAFEAAATAGDAETALAAYRGPLLQGERLDGLALRARERLAHRLAAVLLSQAARWRAEGRTMDALALLGRGLAAEPDNAALQAALRA